MGALGRTAEEMVGAQASAVMLLDHRGKPLVWRDYRGDADGEGTEEAASFWAMYTQVGDDGEAVHTEPVMRAHNGRVTFAYVQHSNVFLVASTRSNANASLLLSFLHKLKGVLEAYFGRLEEESVRDNFVLVYELLDETMDFGYPQYTEAKVLQEYIRVQANKLLKSEQRAPMAVTNAVSWRQQGIKYKRNEVFLDVLENLRAVVNSSGQVVSSSVDGKLDAQAFLSGMPECKLGLNDKAMLEAHGRTTRRSRAVELEDIKFHQCVRLSRFDTDRTISFIPPDGHFQLMSYRISGPVKPLLWITPHVECTSRTRVKLRIILTADFRERNIANSIAVTVPVHPDATDPSTKPSHGSAEYVPEHEAIVWYVKQMPGGREYSLNAEFSLPTTSNGADAPTGKRPIQLTFEVPYYTVSGTQVRYLKVVEKSGYTAYPWVRYLTRGESIEFRL